MKFQWIHLVFIPYKNCVKVNISTNFIYRGVQKSVCKFATTKKMKNWLYIKLLLFKYVHPKTYSKCSKWLPLISMHFHFSFNLIIRWSKLLSLFKILNSFTMCFFKFWTLAIWLAKTRSLIAPTEKSINIRSGDHGV